MRPHLRRSAAHRLTLAAVACAAALAIPTVAGAQRLVPTGVRGAAATVSQADALDAQAAAVEDSHRHARDLLASAILRESAARLRAPTDARAVASLRVAAFARYYAGDTAAAAALLEAAADRAAARGDVARAVTDHLDAASVALELRQPVRARRQVERARRLARSPAVSPAQRVAFEAAIAKRFQP